jgi:hypothetical protein
MVGGAPQWLGVRQCVPEILVERHWGFWIYSPFDRRRAVGGSRWQVSRKHGHAIALSGVVVYSTSLWSSMDSLQTV